MSSVVNPIGPEEPSTYWRRRAIVVVSLLVLIWVGWMILSAAMGGGTSNASAPSPAGSPSFGIPLSETPTDDPDAEDESGSASPTSSESKTTSPSPSGSTSDSPSGSTSASPSTSASASGGACSSSDLVVKAIPAPTTVTAASGAALTISVANTGTTACTQDVGSGANEITVSSGGSQVFSSDDCNPSKATKEVALEPGTPWTATVTWDVRRSAPGCASGQATVPPGTYQVIARNGSTSSEPVTITVE